MNKTLLPSLLRALLAVGLALPAAARADDAPPAQDAAKDPLAAFRKIPFDKEPEEITRDTHYWRSNETRLDLFHDAVKGKGGVYIGVGTDQNYLLAGWAKADVLVLMDFDQAIVDLHHVYRVAFQNAADPDAFLALWQNKNRKKLKQLLRAAYPKGKVRWGALKAYNTARWTVAKRLKAVRAQMTEAKLPSFLNDAAQYTHVKKLFDDDKVFMVRGDLTQHRALRAIGKAARDASLTVGVLYLSNAEQYFPYARKFRRNIAALPLSDDSVVVRTSGWRKFPRVKGTYYHYNVQSGQNLQAWLDDKRRPRGLGMMLRHRTPTPVRGFSELNLPPDEARAASRARRKKAAKKARRRPKRRKGAKARTASNKDEG